MTFICLEESALGVSNKQGDKQLISSVDTCPEAQQLKYIYSEETVERGLR